MARVGGGMHPRGVCNFVFLVLLICPLLGNALEQHDSAPNFSLPVLYELSAERKSSTPYSLLHLSEYRGQVVYVDFWSTTCAPCRDSLKMLSALQLQFDRDDVAIISINIDPNPRDTLAFLRARPVTFPVVSDPSGRTADLYAVTTLPHAILIDQSGTVRDIHRGAKATTSTQQSLYAKLAHLSAEPNQARSDGRNRSDGQNITTITNNRTANQVSRVVYNQH